MAIAPETAEELRTLLGSARAYLEQEEELGLDSVRPGLPVARAVEDSAVAASAGPTGARAASAPAQQARAVSSPAVPPGVSAAEPAASPSVPGATPALPKLPLEDRHVRLATLADEARACKACVLHEQRKQSVFARGNPESRIVFVGEGPGRDEDEQGQPFVGKAGQLLDKMVVAMGFARDDVYICNVVKCRPPENRTPRPEEMLACKTFLVPQIEAIAPEVIVALGRCAAQALGAAEATGSWRGRWSSWQGVPVMPTYHPAFLLRSPEFKRTVWEDLQLVMKRLGMQAPKRG